MSAERALRLLAIETATEACSCALVCDSASFTRHEIAPRRHADLILQLVDAVLNEAGVRLSDLDGLAFGRGPGSFTGVRIATGVVQGLAFGAGLRVAPVSTLRALAQGVYREHHSPRVAVALDARMAEVYWGTYSLRGDVMVPLVDECVVSPARVPHSGHAGELTGAGSGWARYAAELESALGRRPSLILDNALPNALDVAALARGVFERGEAVEPEQALPVYLRDRVTS